MSVILAVVTNELAIMVGDTRASSEDGSFQDNVPKVFHLNSGTIIGCAGSVGAIQKFVFEYRKAEDLFQIPKAEWPEGALTAIVFKPKEKRLFEITGHYEETENAPPCVHGIGSGGQIAEVTFSTILETTKKKITSLSEKELIALMKKGVQKACDMNLFCGGEIIVKGGRYK